MTTSRRVLGSSQGLTLLETAAVMLIVAILTVPLVAVAGRLIVLPVEWQENLGTVRDAREALHLVASDARQAACYIEGDSEDDYGTFKWTDYTETPTREFRVRYYSDTAYSDGSRNLLREEIIDASPPRTIPIGDVSEFGISLEERLIRAWVKIPSWAEKGSDAPLLGISALMRPGGPASADC
ncbi:MAG: type II secretion system protein [Dehalococcoidia bacterium]|nr:type II secretion system protein [Dehalococcoidia bacterium]